MTPERSKKPSGTRRAFLFLIGIVLVFLAIAGTVSMFATQGDEESVLDGMLASGNKIGVIPIDGTITTSDRVLKQISKFRKRKSIKAIVLRINSPGGAVAPAQEIFREIERTRRTKPVVASIESLGASAAYYIASRSNRVICSRGTITGSIGVIMTLADVHKIIEKIGINVSVIKAGKFKDMGSGVRPLTEEERRILEDFAKEIHEQFINDVAEARKGKIDKAKLRSVADGSFFSGEKALRLGLVDGIGNFYDAVKIAGDLAGIKGKTELVYPERKWESYLDLLMESAVSALSRHIERGGLMQPIPALH